MLSSASICWWLVYSALLSLVVLTIGSGAVLLCRQPARRLRVIELTLLGCLVAPWLGMIPGYPHLAIGWWPRSPSEPQGVAATRSTGSGIAAADAPVDAAPGSVSRVSSRPNVEAIQTPAWAWHVGSWLAALYVLGVAIGAAWWLAGVAALTRIVWSARAAPLRCRQLLGEIAGRRGGRVRLLASRRARQPFASVGVAVQLPPQRGRWNRAVIVLPEDLCGDDQAVRWALAHEWAHVERHDFRAWFVAGLTRVLLFYQPLVWWLRGQLRLCQDFVADARASREASQPEDYAEFLTARAAAGSLHPAMVGLGMGFRRSELYTRVAMLVDGPPLESRAPRLWNALVSLAALVLIGILPALSFAPESAAQEEPLQRTSPTARKVEFAIGPNQFGKGDKIEIQEVWSEVGSLAEGDTVTVKGTYTLASCSAATLLFSVTETSRSGRRGGDAVARKIIAGSAPFEMRLPVAVDGYLHIGFYEPTGAFGNVYFGTSRQMREIAGWDLEKWMNRGR